MAGSRSPDCVLVGSFDVDFDALYRSAEPTRQRSAFLSYLQHNSVLLAGRRETYSGLLNHVITAVTGQDPRLHVGRLPNLASCYLASFLRRRGLSVEIVNSLPHDIDALVAALAAPPRAVALSTTLYVDPTPVVETVKLIRHLDPSVPILVGGPFVFNLCRNNPTLSQSYLFRQMGADAYVVESQGEATLARILERYRSGSRDLTGIPNVIWKRPDGSFCREASEAEDNDLDQNAIDWSGFPRSYLGPTLQTRTARSCAFHCSFCSHPEMAGPLKLAGLDVIEKELEQMAELGVQNVVFIDDTFNVPLPRFKKLCRLWIDRGFPMRWFSYFRPGNADGETFDLMERAGCAGVFLGVESGAPSVLQQMDKFAKVDAQATGIRRLNERGIITFASFIVGFPGETDATVETTMSFIEENRPRFYRAEVWYADPGTPIMREALQHGVRGAAFSWEHRTMTWSRAAEWVKTMYSQVKGSLVLPVYGFDFWSLPYLLGQGLSLELVEKFCDVAREMMLASMETGGVPDQSRLEKLISLVTPPTGDRARLDVPQPAF